MHGVRISDSGFGEYAALVCDCSCGTKLNFASQVTTAGAFIAALFVQIRFQDLSDGERSAIESISDVLLGQNELFLKTQAVAGLAFASTGLALLVGLIALLGRICHARHTRSNHRIFFCLVCGMHMKVMGGDKSQKPLLIKKKPH